ncbi:YtxH domain-containing protein [Streptomyces albiaxialis]|uniref:YtxH domain-containing protein n=1 Tax=Streptomyces albiaxialis TaxID=329523 RepID=A0ABN2WBF8_9ACTN
MRYRLTFVTGLAVGYVLGTRAGRERYEQLRKGARRIAENPAVRNVGEAAALTGRRAAAKTAGTVGEKVGHRLPGAVTDRFSSSGGRRTAPARGPADDDWGPSNT